MNDCPDEDVLSRWAARMLTADEIAAVNDHLDECEQCLAIANAKVGEPKLVTPVANRSIAFPGPPDPDSPFGRVGGYAIRGELGKGAYSVVFLAHAIKLARDVALKVLKPEYAELPADYERFVGEARLTASIVHPNVIKIVDVHEANAFEGFPLPMIEMEYIAGGTLRTAINSKSNWPWGRAARVARDIASGLAAAHAEGLIHRDLKPGNVLLDRNQDKAVIVDFGLARSIGDAMAPMFEGTKEYVPQDERIGTPKRDIFALGVILQKMLAKNRSRGRSPRDLLAIVKGCLTADTGRCYNAAAAVAIDLERYQALLPPLIDPGSPFWRTWLLLRRHAAATVATAALLVATSLWGIREYDKLQDAKSRQHADLVRLADEALAAGKNGDAVELFDRAIADNRDDRDELRVRRLPALFDVAHRGRLDAEFSSIEEGRLSSASLALLQLHHSDYLLWTLKGDGNDAAFSLLDAAIASGALPPADLAYARGLRAEGSTSAIAGFREALELRPRHARAQTALIFESIIMGHHHLAREQLAIARSLRPDDPTHDFADALLALFVEDSAAFERFRSANRRATADARVNALFDRLFDGVREAIAVNRRMHAKPKNVFDRFFKAASPFVALAKVQAAGNGLTSLTGDDKLQLASAIGFGVPILDRPPRMANALIDAHAALRQGNFDRVYEIVERTRVEYPEVVLFALGAAAGMGAADKCRTANDSDGYVRNCERIRQYALAAESAPSILPSGPYANNTRWLRYMAEYELNANAFEGLARDGVGIFSTEPWAVVVPLAVVANHRPLPVYSTSRAAQELAVASKGYDEARAFILPLLAAHIDPSQSRMLLEDWLVDEIDEAEPAELLARMEISRKNYGAAIRAANEAISRKSPSRGEMRQISERAAKAIAEELSKP